MSRISAIRESLQNVLGENHSRYMSSLRDLFSQRSSKDEFDLDVLPFLQGEALHLHNQFMFVILGECHNRTSLSPVPYSNSNSNNNTILYKPTNIVNIVNNDVTSNHKPVSITTTSTVAIRRSTPIPKRRKSSATIRRNQMVFARFLEIFKRNASPPKDSRFPNGFVREFLKSHDKSKCLNPNVIANVTHFPTLLNKHVARDPRLAKFFSQRKRSDQPFLTTNPTVQGKLLLKAWSKGINTIDADAMDLIIKACHAQIKRIVTSLLNRQKEFKSEEVAREACPYPELRRGSYVEDLDSKREPERIGGFLQIQVGPKDERDRIAALESSFSLHTKLSRMKTRATPSDLCDLLQADKSLIPNSRSRHLLQERLFLVPGKDAYSTHESLSNSNSNYENGYGNMGIDEDEDDQDLLPVCSY